MRKPRRAAFKPTIAPNYTNLRQLLVRLLQLLRLHLTTLIYDNYYYDYYNYSYYFTHPNRLLLHTATSTTEHDFQQHPYSYTLHNDNYGYGYYDYIRID